MIFTIQMERKIYAYGLFFTRGGGKPFAQKILQVSQIFTKQSNRNEGQCNDIGCAGI